jgi:hypothetical protein
MYDYKTDNLLNYIKVTEGKEGLIECFNKLMKQDTKKALSLLNDDSLHFGALFILKANFKESKYFNYLNERNQIAIRIINEIEEPPKGKQVFNDYILNYVQIVHSVLKWVFETGIYDDNLNDEYDRVIDTAGIFLVKLYRDKNILPRIAEVIFKRNELDLYIHDLVWAFFEGREAHSLIFIANGLKSGMAKSYELARKLLNFIPELGAMNHEKGEEQYEIVIRWLNENSSYLLFTGECFNQTGKPVICNIVLHAKYISKHINNETGDLLEELKDSELALLEQFNKLDYKTKVLLSNYSHRLHRNNFLSWNTWLNYSIEEQISISLAGEYYDKNFR